jgi:hypothetical protein
MALATETVFTVPFLLVPGSPNPKACEETESAGQCHDVLAQVPRAAIRRMRDETDVPCPLQIYHGHEPLEWVWTPQAVSKFMERPEVAEHEAIGIRKVPRGGSEEGPNPAHPCPVEQRQPLLPGLDGVIRGAGKLGKDILSLKQHYSLLLCKRRMT